MVNKVILVGHVGATPDDAYTKTGSHWASFSLATGEKWKDDKGQLQEKTEWHKVYAWNKLADVVSKYVDKGSLLYIEGKITYQVSEKNGEKKYFTSIVADTLKLLNSTKETRPIPEPPRSASETVETKAPTPTEGTVQAAAKDDDDLPF